MKKMKQSNNHTHISGFLFPAISLQEIRIQYEAQGVQKFNK